MQRLLDLWEWLGFYSIEVGSGDYCRERDELLKGATVKSIVKEIRSSRRGE